MTTNAHLIIESPARLNLHLYRWGSAGSPCYLVHGSGDHCRVWDCFASRLLPDYCVYALDLRGHGDSSWDKRGRYTPADYAGDLLSALDSLSTGPATLIGHSLGADVVMQVASARPERVRSVVLVDPGIGRTDFTRTFVRDTLLSTPRSFDSISSYCRVLREQRPLADAALLPDIARHSLRRGEDGSFEVKFDPAIATSPDDSDPAKWWATLKALKCPLLLVRGSGSAVLSSQVAQRIVRNSAHGTLRVITVAGHGVMIDNPHEFAATVLEFLNQWNQDRAKAAG